MKTSYTKQKFGRQFFSCPNYKLKRAYGFFARVDPPKFEHRKMVLRRMQERQERLNVESLNVDMLKGEIEKHRNLEKKYKLALGLLLMVVVVTLSILCCSANFHEFYRMCCV